MTDSTNYQFLKGMGVGIVAGITLGVAMTPKKANMRSTAGKAFKAVGDILENITDAMGM